jgi:hypothetical protein
MLSKKDFPALFEQHWFKIALQTAISIQQTALHDSIIADGRPTADFFDSIDQKRTVSARILRSAVRTRIAQDQLKALRCFDTKGHARAALARKLGQEDFCVHR